jgi:hypothetical protein
VQCTSLAWRKNPLFCIWLNYWWKNTSVGRMVIGGERLPVRDAAKKEEMSTNLSEIGPEDAGK